MNQDERHDHGRGGARDAQVLPEPGAEAPTRPDDAAVVGVLALERLMARLADDEADGPGGDGRWDADAGRRSACVVTRAYEAHGLAVHGLRESPVALAFHPH